MPITLSEIPAIPTGASHQILVLDGSATPNFSSVLRALNGVISIDVHSRYLKGSSGQILIDWSNQKFVKFTGGQCVTVTNPGPDANYSIANGDYYVEMHPVTIGITCSLPAGPTSGQMYIVKLAEKTGFDVNVDGSGTNIEGSATDSIAGSLVTEPSKTYIFNGTEWKII